MYVERGVEMAWFAWWFFVLALIAMRHFGILDFGAAFLIGFWGAVGGVVYLWHWLVRDEGY